MLKHLNFLLQPHNHSKKVAKFYYATPELVNKAIDSSLEAKKEWEKVPLDDKFKLFLDVADLMGGKYIWYQFGCRILKMVGSRKHYFWPKIKILKGNHCILRLRRAPIRQNLGMILENKVVQKLKLEKTGFLQKKWSPKLIFLD